MKKLKGKGFQFALFLVMLLFLWLQGYGFRPDKKTKKGIWNMEKLTEAQKTAQEIGTYSFLLITDGEIISSWGDIATPTWVHSVRKALLSALVGQYLGTGPKQINLNKTLAELNIDDTPNPLTPLQKQATVLHLIKSISGINHGAAAEIDSMRIAKTRLLGKKPNPPGKIWAYNNWDYNALTTIFEQETGLTVYEAFNKGIAEPLNMKDFDKSCFEYVFEKGRSKHAKAGFKLSARDMAAFGLLYLNMGKWEGKQLLPVSWIERITQDYSLTDYSGTRSGHGYLWWVPNDLVAKAMGIPKGTYIASGFGSQRIVVIPAWNTVLVHKVNSNHYGECCLQWAQSQGFKYSSQEELDERIYMKFLAYLVRECNKPENKRNQICQKCRWVTTSEYQKFFTQVLKANNYHKSQVDLNQKNIKKLEKLNWDPTFISHLGCLKGCLDFLNIKVSKAWLFGGTGWAFAINIHERVESQGVSVWRSQETKELAKNLGFSVETVSSHRSAKDFSQKQQMVWNRVREAINNEQPCYAFHLLVPEDYVIFGYDPNGYYFKGVHRLSGTGPKHWQRLGKTSIGRLSVKFVKPCTPASDRQTIKEALQFALKLSTNTGNWTYKGYKLGLAAYQQWIKAIEEKRANGYGMAYNSAAWAECRKYAVQFLQESKSRISSKLNPLFEEAIEHYHEVSHHLDRISQMFPFQNTTDAQMQIGIEDHQRCRKAIWHLERAMGAEGAGLKVLRRIVSHMQ
jgi:CubicO group peptidase (beta-lactamase class C family)